MRQLRLAALLAAGLLVGRVQAQTLDLVLKNGRVDDGTGSPWYRADAAIRHGRLVRALDDHRMGKSFSSAAR